MTDLAHLPVYSLAELGDVLTAFRCHLDLHREFIVRCGLPREPFRRSPWLDRTLGRLYDTRATSSPVPAWEIDPVGWGPGSEPYTFVRVETLLMPSAGGWLTTSEPVPAPCLEADLLNGLAEQDATRVESDRGRLHRLKVDALTLAADALGPGVDARLRRQWVKLLGERLTAEDAAFYFRLDRYYRGSDAIGDARARPGGGPPGGLSDLVEVLGHVECEQRLGVWAEARSRLPDMLFGDAGFRPPDSNGLSSEEAAEIEEAWRVLAAGRPAVEAFWTEFAADVGRRIEERFRRSIAVPVRPAAFDQAAEYLRQYATHLENSVEQGLPPERPFTPSDRPVWDAQTRQLSYAGEVVTTYRRYGEVDAIGQVLTAFQEEGWPDRVDDPLPPDAEKDSGERRQNLVKSLNRTLSTGPIRFGESGEGFCWRPHG